MRTPLVAVIVAFVVSRLIFAAFHFHYNLFTDPFDIVKFLIDFGTWAGVFMLTTLLMQKLPGKGA